jgi:hypothetical protein
MDMRSDPPLRPLVQRFIDQGTVVYEHFRDRAEALAADSGYRAGQDQRFAYARCWRLHAPKHRFIGFFDADEFIVVNQTATPRRQLPATTLSAAAGAGLRTGAAAAAAAGVGSGTGATSVSAVTAASLGVGSARAHSPLMKMMSLDEFMQQYDGYAGVSLNWYVLGSDGHETRPRGGLRANYRRCSWSQLVKSLCNTALSAGSRGTHECATGRGRGLSGRAARRARVQAEGGGGGGRGPWVVDPERRPVRGPRNFSPPTPLAFIYHFFTKSREEWEWKMARGNGQSRPQPRRHFQTANERANVTCDLLLPRRGEFEGTGAGVGAVGERPP